MTYHKQKPTGKQAYSNYVLTKILVEEVIAKNTPLAIIKDKYFSKDIKMWVKFLQLHKVYRDAEESISELEARKNVVLTYTEYFKLSEEIKQFAVPMAKDIFAIKDIEKARAMWLDNKVKPMFPLAKTSPSKNKMAWDKLYTLSNKTIKTQEALDNAIENNEEYIILSTLGIF